MITIKVYKDGNIYAVAAEQVTAYAASPAAALRAVVGLASDEINAMACQDWNCTKEEIDDHREVAQSLVMRARTQQ